MYVAKKKDCLNMTAYYHQHSTILALLIYLCLWGSGEMCTYFVLDIKNSTEIEVFGRY